MMGGVKTQKEFIISALAGLPMEAATGVLPSRIQLFKWGKNPSQDGDYIVNEQTVAALAAQIDKGIFKRIVVDFDHQSEKASPNYQPAPRHHAAYGDVAVSVNEGVFLENIEWTEKGKEFATDYADFSPVALHTPEKVVLGITSVGLVPNGALLESTLFSATVQPEGDNMSEEDKGGEEKPAEETMEQKVNAFTEALAALKEQFAGLLEKFGKLEEAKAADESGQQISALAAKLEAGRKEHMLQLAVLQGKAVTLAEETLGKMSVEELAQHLSTLQATVPVVSLTPTEDPGAAAPDKAAAQNRLMDEIRKETGITDFQKLWNAARTRKPELF